MPVIWELVSTDTNAWSKSFGQSLINTFVMYLENSEQNKGTREGEPSTEGMFAEQCQVPRLTEAADLTGPSKGSAELGVKVLLQEYTEQAVSEEMDPSIPCLEQCNLNSDELESCTYFNGHADSFEQYSESNGFFESDQILDKCETSELSQPCDECTQHCECFKSSEHCGNHSSASECSACCEQCAEHLQLFQKCKPSDQQLEISDLDADELEVNCGSLGLCGRCDFNLECTDHPEALQQYEPSQQQSDGFDSESDTSTENFQQCETMDSLNCNPEVCEYDEISDETEFTNDEDDEEAEEEDYYDDDDGDFEDDLSYKAKQNETEFSDEESHSSSEDTPVQVYFDDTENVAFATDLWETHEYTKEDFQQALTTEVSTESGEPCGNDDYEVSQEPYKSESSGEEDGSSDCSSVETKSFKTCPEGSIPSDPFSDSSEESDKGPQEDSSDEQTEWESFEDEEVQQSDENKSKTVDVTVEDYFDLFDKVDYYRHIFTQKQRYISCFDGGDIHDHLYLEEEAKKHKAKTLYQFEDINREANVKDTDTCSDDASEDTYEEVDVDQSDGSCNLETQSEDWLIAKSESSFEEDDESKTENGVVYAENDETAEDDKAPIDEEACASDDHVSEEAEVHPSTGPEGSMFAPLAKEISVEGDAYEDILCSSHYCEPKPSAIDETASITDYTEDDKAKPEPEDDVFITCSEKEPYWSLIDNDENRQLCEPGVEEYYVYQIKSIQSSFKQALNGFILERNSHDQITNDENASRSQSQDALISLKELAATGLCPEECVSDTFGINEVIDMNSSAVEEECVLNEISKETGPPVGIIHSVQERDMVLMKTEDNNDSEQSRESDEDQSDDESYETCECDYCITPTEEV